MIVEIVLGCLVVAALVTAIVLWKADKRQTLTGLAIGACAVVALVALAIVAG